MSGSAVIFNKQVPADRDPGYGVVEDPEIKDRDGRGLPELMVKFDRQQVQDILEAGESMENF